MYIQVHQTFKNNSRKWDCSGNSAVPVSTSKYRYVLVQIENYNNFLKTSSIWSNVAVHIYCLLSVLVFSIEQMNEEQITMSAQEITEYRTVDEAQVPVGSVTAPRRRTVLSKHGTTVREPRYDDTKYVADDSYGFLASVCILSFIFMCKMFWK